MVDSFFVRESVMGSGCWSRGKGVSTMFTVGSVEMSEGAL